MSKRRPTVGVKAVHDSGSEIMLYFDKSTFLLNEDRSERWLLRRWAASWSGARPSFRDHKSFGGAKFPSQYKILYDGKLIVEGETAAIKVHATIDPAWFGTEGPARIR